MAEATTEKRTKKRRRRPGRRRATVSGYFREHYPEPRVFLQTPNAELVEAWTRDHPSATKKMLKKVKANLANLKSVLRKDLREAKGGRGGRQAAGEQAPGGEGGTPFEKLEEYIDECLTMAKTLDREGLASVIRHLRDARNLVVWKIDH